MKLNIIFLILVVLFAVSCNGFFSNKDANNAKQNRINESINYSSLDAYPLLPECEHITNRILQKDCFYKQLTNRMQISLDENLFEIDRYVQDTIWVKIIINSLGKTKVKSIIVADKVKEILPQLDSMFHVSVQKLPILKPGIKLGIPVTSEFSLPILIQNN